VSEIERWKTTTAYECPACGALHASFDGECPLECGAELREVEVVAEHRLTDVRAENERLRGAGEKLVGAVLGLDSYAALGGAPLERSARADDAIQAWHVANAASVPELVERSRALGPVMEAQGERVAEGLREAADRMRGGE
jgi:hypothetical protein